MTKIKHRKMPAATKTHGPRRSSTKRAYLDSSDSESDSDTPLTPVVKKIKLYSSNSCEEPYWKVEDEIVLNATSTHEFSLWRRTQRFFNMNPPELLQNLKVELTCLDLKDTEGNFTIKNTNLPHAFCKKLGIIVCCPVFNHRPKLLQYAIELAIYYRLKSEEQKKRPDIMLLTSGRNAALMSEMTMHLGVENPSKSVVFMLIDRILGKDRPRHHEFLKGLKDAVSSQPKPHGAYKSDMNATGILSRDLDAIVSSWDEYATRRENAIELKTMKEYQAVAAGERTGISKEEVLRVKKRAIIDERAGAELESQGDHRGKNFDHTSFEQETIIPTIENIEIYESATQTFTLEAPIQGARSDMIPVPIITTYLSQMDIILQKLQNEGSSRDPGATPELCSIELSHHIQTFSIIHKDSPPDFHQYLGERQLWRDLWGISAAFPGINPLEVEQEMGPKSGQSLQLPLAGRDSSQTSVAVTLASLPDTSTGSVTPQPPQSCLQDYSRLSSTGSLREVLTPPKSIEREGLEFPKASIITKHVPHPKAPFPANSPESAHFGEKKLSATTPPGSAIAVPFKSSSFRKYFPECTGFAMMPITDDVSEIEQDF